ncbi:MAG: nitrite reductase small subunit NirD [Pseudomonadota bacterium]|jgi:NAD(P)H-dependent nitrite reductase small subunit|nr:MAG: nitrite reductase (NAD(P)H) small subunit [Pseudomonadota bacterium]
MSTGRRHFVCTLEDILDGGGACALVDGEQLALMRVGDEVFAVENRDPFSGANVIARGLVGDISGQLVVASPVYKQHFNLRTGRCLEDEAVSLRTWPCGVLDGRVWVESQAQAAGGARGRKRLVVVGNGMAAMRTVEELLELAGDEYQITIFGAEPRGNYNRILLSPLLAGETAREALMLHPLEWYREKGITLHAGDPVVSIDRRSKRVISASGVVAGYDRLLLATGSDPVRLKVAGHDLPGVFCFRSIDDVEAMLAQAGSARQAVVVGGGLLGLEAASGLAKQGLSVTVVHIRDRVMDKQLDEEAAGLLRRAMEARGIRFCMPARTAAFEGRARVEQLRTEDGRVLPADMVVVAAGITPRTELARACGLTCDRGILVDDTLQTYDPSIYAVGECVQHRGTTYGLVAPLWEQARVCAAHLAERGVTRFRGSKPASQLKVSGIDVFSAGDIAQLRSAESIRYADHAAGVYKRLWLRENRLLAAVLFGDTRAAPQLAELIETQRDVSALRETLLLGESA